MIAIQLRFTAGRYCATPWGRQVNEGQVEWPPSPWRLLRALVAVWKRTLPNVPENEFAALLHQLATPPLFSLPSASQGHARHYMPIIESGKEKVTLIFDAFVTVLRDDPLIMHWPGAELTSSQQELLTALLTRLPYFGRAESWCEAALAEGSITDKRITCSPIGSDFQPPHSDQEIVTVLCADAALPAPDLLSHLQVETGSLRRARHDPYHPNGSRWYAYSRPQHSLLPSPHSIRTHTSTATPLAPLSAPLPSHAATAPSPVLARYAISATVRPLLLHTINIAEKARLALMSIYGHINGQRTSWRFSGKDDQGQPLHGHQHAFFLPVDEDQDGFLDHLHICLRPAYDYAPKELTFTPEEQHALQQFRKLRNSAEDPLLLTLLYLGPIDSAMKIDLPGTLRTGKVWESVTPYLLPRHPKRSHDSSRWRADSPEQQLRHELAARFGEQVANSASFEELDVCRMPGHTWSWQEFQRWRPDREKVPPYRPGFGVRITFQQPIEGPIALGYGCHFGLGQFHCTE